MKLLAPPGSVFASYSPVGSAYLELAWRPRGVALRESSWNAGLCVCPVSLVPICSRCSPLSACNKSAPVALRRAERSRLRVRQRGYYCSGSATRLGLSFTGIGTLCPAQYCHDCDDASRQRTPSAYRQSRGAGWIIPQKYVYFSTATGAARWSPSTRLAASELIGANWGAGGRSSL